MGWRQKSIKAVPLSIIYMDQGSCRGTLHMIVMSKDAPLNFAYAPILVVLWIVAGSPMNSRHKFWRQKTRKDDNSFFFLKNKVVLNIEEKSMQYQRIKLC